MRTVALLAALALASGLAGGVAGALIAGGDNDAPAATTAPVPASAPVAAANRSARGLTPEEIYRRDAPGVVVITDTQTQQLPATFFGGPQRQRIQALGSRASSSTGRATS